MTLQNPYRNEMDPNLPHARKVLITPMLTVLSIKPNVRKLSVKGPRE